MDSRRDFTSKKVFSGYFSELGEKANSALPRIGTRRRQAPAAGGSGAREELMMKGLG